MPHELIERKAYKELFDNGESDGIALRKGFIPGEIKAVEDNVLRFIISTGSLDRDHDTIEPTGWDLANYILNPVVLFGHNHREPSIGQSIKIFIEGANLISDALFVTDDIQEFGAMIYRLYLGGFMRATSVGFMPDERVWSDEQGGIRFITQELLEYSMVPVPANPEALIIARGQGIDITPLKGWCESLLDDWDSGSRSVGASRKQLERIAKEADKKNKTYHVPAEKQEEIRQRNIWEPRLKVWFDEAALIPPDAWECIEREWDDEDVPEFIWTEWEGALDVFAKQEGTEDGSNTSVEDEDLEGVSGDVDLDANEEDGNDSDEPDEDINVDDDDLDADADDTDPNLAEGISQLHITINGLDGDSEEVKLVEAALIKLGIPADQIFELDLDEDHTEEFVTGLEDLQTEFNNLEETIRILRAENADLKSEVETLLLDKGKSLIERAEEVPAIKIIERFSELFRKRLNKITGRIDDDLE